MAPGAKLLFRYGYSFLFVAAFLLRRSVATECTNVPTQPATSNRALHLAILGHSGSEGAAGLGGLLRADSAASGSAHGSLRRILRGSGHGFGRLPPADHAQAFLEAVPLRRVRLAPGSPQGAAQDTNLRYLLMLDADCLVWSFRATANLTAPGTYYGGWELPTSELRGHFVGHYLSAAAMLWASTGDEALRAKMEAVVDALEECQLASGGGYLSAFPEELFDRFEAIQPVWAPYYTIHKIMAGLLDQYLFAGSARALAMVERMAAHFAARVARVVERFTIARHWQSLNEEIGGMNDVLYQLFTVTGNVEHLKLAHLFDKPCFLGPLALRTDDLSGLHSNTHIPLVVGSQMRYEVTGDRAYKGIAEYFMELINTTHGFTSGGTSASEFWGNPKSQGSQLHQEDQESCTTYNMLKVSRALFRWTRQVAHADYYEKALLNGVLGIQRGAEPGVMIYMLPMGPGDSKARGYHGWGTPFDAFWCCYGSGIESFSKLGDSIYFTAGGGGGGSGAAPELFVAQFVSSSVEWTAAGLSLRQVAPPPSSAHPWVDAAFEFGALGAAEAQDGAAREMEGEEAVLNVRVPWWAKAVVTSGNSSRGSAAPGSFWKLPNKWRAGDRVGLSVKLGLRTERIQDDREAYSSLHSVLFGPFLLVGLTAGDRQLAPGLDPAAPDEWVRPVDAARQNPLLVTLALAAPPGGPPGPATPPVALRHDGGGTLVGSPLPVAGTEAAAQATFRVVVLPPSGGGGVDPPGGKGSSRGQQILLGAAAAAARRAPGGSPSDPSGIQVALELFDRPGQFLQVGPPAGRAAGAVACGVATVRRARAGALPAGPPGLKHLRAAGAAFAVLPGLAGAGTISLAPAGRQGREFLSLRPQGAGSVAAAGGLTMAAGDVGLAGPVSDGLDLQLWAVAPPPAGGGGAAEFAAASSFAVDVGVAQYHDITFVAEGAAQDFLLQPIAAVRDESYTAYFNISGAGR